MLGAYAGRDTLNVTAATLRALASSGVTAGSPADNLGSDWPPLTHAHTLARLRASDDELPTFLPELLSLMPQMLTTTESLAQRTERALSYPWERPTEPCLIAGGEVLPDGPIDDGQLRWPVIAIGSNASPARLALKFCQLEPSPIRLVPATLADHDICAAPVPTPYGAFPAILAESPGTQVRVALTWLTQAQIELLTLTEFGYRFGRLDGVQIAADDGSRHTSALVYAGRLGLYRAEPGGREPVALAAIPATKRAYPAMTQRDLLDDCATRIGLAGGADALLTTIFSDPDFLTGGCYPPLLDAALPAPLSRLTLHPLP